MTHIELKQIRLALFLECAEAAHLIGQCEPRSWQRWEDSTRAVPADVADQMRMLAAIRHERLAVAFDPADPNYRYFDSYAEYQAVGGKGTAIMWKLAQSVSAALLLERVAGEWQATEVIQPE